MIIFENIRLSFSSLIANKMRALLTMLGIIIGIGAVIGIVTIGDSLSGYVSNTMKELGANNITLQVKSSKQAGPSGMSSMSQYSSDMQLMTDEMLDGLETQFPNDIMGISKTESVGSGQTKKAAAYANVSLTGVSPDYEEVNALTLIQGRFINEVDIADKKKLAVVSDKLVENMFGNENPIGKSIDLTIGNLLVSVTIIGVYEYTASSMGFSMYSDADIQTDVYIPLSTAKKYTKNDGYSNVTVLTSLHADANVMTKSIEAYFERYYEQNADYTVSAFSMESIVNSMTDMINTLKVAISSIAAISLLVGGIGVMNIMLVSITERTREIGTRKALGATNLSIRIQFIVEAIVICVLGGSIGVLLGTVIGMAGSKLLGFEAVPSMNAIITAVAFSMAIGVFFGYYPANKAAKMDPIDALRYE